LLALVNGQTEKPDRTGVAGTVLKGLEFGALEKAPVAAN
jgi:hypothetical protein